MKRTTRLIPIQLALALALAASTVAQDSVKIGEMMFQGTQDLDQFQAWITDKDNLLEYLHSVPRPPAKMDAMIDWLPAALKTSTQKKVNDVIIVPITIPGSENFSGDDAKTAIAFAREAYKSHRVSSLREETAELELAYRERLSDLNRAISEKQHALESLVRLESRVEEIDNMLFGLELEAATAEARREIIESKLAQEAANAERLAAATGQTQEHALMAAEKKLSIAMASVEQKKQMYPQGMFGTNEFATAQLALIEAEAELSAAKAKLTTRSISTPLYEQLRAMLMEEEISLAGLAAKRTVLVHGRNEMMAKSEEASKLRNDIHEFEQQREKSQLELQRNSSRAASGDVAIPRFTPVR